ncbi:hypothetical protein QFC24_003794 [Naganishia onofrii]|uniref:Uncharacterized protein n=1 Tax=Naganishia onofrii TaxID=1851511 RepID=A0ACC2XHT4_9TREE|nr:hypothetical protein QFC24_003794 [Naganishia onofrii]
MEEETELALLEQRLVQTNKLASRMTNILSQLDSRLSKLDKTIAPFGIQPLSKEAQSIYSYFFPEPCNLNGLSFVLDLQNALSILGGTDVKTKIIKSEFAVGKHEESIISRSPDDSNLREYTNAMDRLLKEIERLSKNDLRSAETRMKDYCRLVDLGARNLVALMIKHVKAGAPTTSDLNKLARDGPTSPPNSLSTLSHVVPIMQYLIRLPRSTSHPAGSSIQVTMSQARETYLSVRHDYIVKKCISPAISDFNELLEDRSPGRDEEGRRDRCDKLLIMLQGMLALMQSERMLLDHLFPKSSAKSFLSIFATPANMVEELLNSQIAYIKKSLASQTFYALELYQTLLHVQPDWEAITTELDFDPSVVRLVSETLNSLRNPCLRSFPEALVDIRVSPSSGKGETSSIADVTYRTVHYLSTLPAYEEIVINLLNSLGDRNWLMGAVTASQRQNDGDSILQHFAADMLSALLEQLESRGRSMRRLTKTTDQKSISLLHAQ